MLRCSNPPQTLSGIETWHRHRICPGSERSNPPQTLSGIETGCSAGESLLWQAPTHPKPSQGLKQV